MKRQLACANGVPACGVGERGLLACGGERDQRAQPEGQEQDEGAVDGEDCQRAGDEDCGEFDGEADAGRGGVVAGALCRRGVEAHGCILVKRRVCAIFIADVTVKFAVR